MSKKFFILIFFMSLILLFNNCGGALNSGNFSVKSPPLPADQLLSPLEDPLMDLQWHLVNTGQKVFATQASQVGNDLNLQTTWNSGIYGNGIKILVSDDGVESGHEDLSANFLVGNYSRNYTVNPYTALNAEPTASTDNHGTSVAGLIAAVGWNHRGGRGVAPKAKLASANFMSDNVSKTVAQMVDQATGNFDVYNQSWGAVQDGIEEINSSYKSQLLYGVTNYRDSKGANYVKASGNSYLIQLSRSPNTIELGNSNFDSTNSTPYTINVAALAASGISASYSSPGSNLWVAAQGGEDGADEPAITTTDRTGCNLGYALSSTLSSLSFQKGANNYSCKYNAEFNGTSSAAPLVSGAVALLLEANPNLTWRDVKYILARTATKIHPTISAQTENPLYLAKPAEYANHKVPNSYVYEQSWIANGAKASDNLTAAPFYYHNWFGFGRINVDAAIVMAKTYTSNFGVYTDTGWNASHKRGSLSVAIPDNNATGASDTMNVATNLKIEAVQLRVKVTHANIGTLAVELTSPSGAKSIVINMHNALDGLANFSGETFLINTFYQETTAGNWVLKVIDGRAGSTGTLTEWSLNFIGAPP